MALGTRNQKYWVPGPSGQLNVALKPGIHMLVFCSMLLMVGAGRAVRALWKGLEDFRILWSEIPEMLLVSSPLNLR